MPKNTRRGKPDLPTCVSEVPEDFTTKEVVTLRHHLERTAIRHAPTREDVLRVTVEHYTAHRQKDIDRLEADILSWEATKKSAANLSDVMDAYRLLPQKTAELEQLLRQIQESANAFVDDLIQRSMLVVREPQRGATTLALGEAWTNPEARQAASAA